MSLDSDVSPAAASSTSEDARASAGATGGVGAASTAVVGQAGVPKASGGRGGRRRAVLNETGVPECLEKLMAAAGEGDGEGSAAAAEGGVGGLLAGLLPAGGAGAGSESEWQALADQLDRSKTCSTIQGVQWVYEHAGCKPNEIDPNDVPSKGSLRLLRWIATSDSNYSEFIKSIWSKTIPNKAEIERGGRFTDDGRTQFKLLDEFEASLKAAEAAREAELAGPDSV